MREQNFLSKDLFGIDDRLPSFNPNDEGRIEISAIMSNSVDDPEKRANSLAFLTSKYANQFSTLRGYFKYKRAEFLRNKKRSGVIWIPYFKPLLRTSFYEITTEHEKRLAKLIATEHKIARIKRSFRRK